MDDFVRELLILSTNLSKSCQNHELVLSDKFECHNLPF